MALIRNKLLKLTLEELDLMKQISDFKLDMSGIETRKGKEMKEKRTFIDEKNKLKLVIKDWDGELFRVDIYKDGKNINDFLYSKKWTENDQGWLRILFDCYKPNAKYGFDMQSILYDGDYYYSEEEKYDNMLFFADEQECKMWFELFLQARETFAELLEKVEFVPQWRTEMGFKYD